MMRKIHLLKNGQLAAKGVIYKDGMVVVRFFQPHSPASGVVVTGDAATGDLTYQQMGRSRGMQADPPLSNQVTSYESADHARENGFEVVLSATKREARRLRDFLMPRRKRGGRRGRR